MAQIIWSNQALSDLLDIAEYIAKDSHKYAQRTVTKLYNKVSVLESNPQIGRIVPELNQEKVREIIEGNYRIIYEVKEREVQILTVHHSARNLTIN
ncbi:MAG: type II toxin-antitoxin system RelE/ParE family toxin [Marinoscillum sp.]